MIILTVQQDTATQGYLRQLSIDECADRILEVGKQLAEYLRDKGATEGRRRYT